MEVTPQVQNKLPKSPASCSLRGTSKALRNILLLHAAMSMYFFFCLFVCLAVLRLEPEMTLSSLGAESSCNNCFDSPRRKLHFTPG